MHALLAVERPYRYRSLDSHYRAESIASMRPKYVPCYHLYCRGAWNQRNHGCVRGISDPTCHLTREYCKCQFSSETDRTATVHLRFSVHCYGDVCVLRYIGCVRMQSFPVRRVRITQCVFVFYYKMLLIIARSYPAVRELAAMCVTAVVAGWQHIRVYNYSISHKHKT